MNTQAIQALQAAIPSLLAQFGAKAKKDELRGRMFVVACQKKALELAADSALHSDYSKLFALETAALTWDWISLPSKLSIAAIFGDPYGKLRDKVRVFAQKWELDPAFIDAMG